MLSEIWEKIKSTAREGIAWVDETFGITELAGRVRHAVAPVADLIGGPLADALSRLSDAVDGIVQLILTPIRRAWDRLSPHLAGFMDGAAEFFREVRDGFLKVVRVHIPNALRWAGARIAEARAWAEAAITAVRRWAGDRVRELRSGLANAIRWVKTEVLAPLWRRITGVWSWITARVAELGRRVEGAIRWVIDEVWTPLLRSLNQVRTFLWGRVLAVVELVESAWTLLMAVKEYGAAGLLLLLLPGRLGDHFARIVRGSADNAGDAVAALDDWADRWLR